MNGDLSGGPASLTTSVSWGFLVNYHEIDHFKIDYRTSCRKRVTETSLPMSPHIQNDIFRLNPSFQPWHLLSSAWMAASVGQKTRHHLWVVGWTTDVDIFTNQGISSPRENETPQKRGWHHNLIPKASYLSKLQDAPTYTQVSFRSRQCGDMTLNTKKTSIWSYAIWDSDLCKSPFCCWWEKLLILTVATPFVG